MPRPISRRWPMRSKAVVETLRRGQVPQEGIVFVDEAGNETRAPRGSAGESEWSWMVGKARQRPDFAGFYGGKEMPEEGFLFVDEAGNETRVPRGGAGESEWSWMVGKARQRPDFAGFYGGKEMRPQPGSDVVAQPPERQLPAKPELALAPSDEDDVSTDATFTVPTQQRTSTAVGRKPNPQLQALLSALRRYEP